MQAFKLDQPVPELQPIGSVSLLGQRRPKAIRRWRGYGLRRTAGRLYLRSVFIHAGSFTMTYPFTEHATVLEGEVELTVSGGEPQASRRATVGSSSRAPKWSGKSSPHASSNTTGERRKPLTHADNPRCPATGIVFMHRSQIQPPFSTFRTIFIEPDANLNYDYPEWLFTSSHSLPLPILCRG